MPNPMSGLVGALAGGVEGFAAGKINESENMQESNMMLIKDIMDRKNMEFKHRLGLERIGVEDEYARGRMELGQEYNVANREDEQGFKTDMMTKEQEFQFKRDEAEHGRRFALEKYRQGQENARSAASSRSAGYDVYINPKDGKSIKVGKNDPNIPDGYFPATYAASTSKQETFDPEKYIADTDINKQYLAANWGLNSDELGNVQLGKGAPLLTSEEKDRLINEARELNLTVRFSGTKEDGYSPVLFTAIPQSQAKKSGLISGAASDGSQPVPKTPKEIADAVLGAKPEPEKGGIVGGTKPRLEVGFVDNGKSFLDAMGGGENAKVTISADINGRTMEIPLAVPTLTEQEFNVIKSGKEPTPAIIKKAIRYAEEKVGAGKNPMDTGSDSVIEGLIDRYKRNMNDPEVKRKLMGEDRESKLKKSFLRTPPKQQ